MNHQKCLMQKRFLTSCKGFTLIELLVVIAIISLLAAFLFPTFARSRENARKTTCQSNLRQLGFAFQQYTQDFSDRYPLVSFPLKSGTGDWITGNEAAGYGLFDYPTQTYTGKSADIQNGSLYSYVKNEGVYQCPTGQWAEYKGLSYSMNCVLGGKKLSTVFETASIVLLIDEDDSLNDGLFSVKNSVSSDGLTSAHNGTGNLLFADGHVKAYVTNPKHPLFGNFPSQRETTVTGQPRFMEPHFTVAGTGCPQS